MPKATSVQNFKGVRRGLEIFFRGVRPFSSVRPLGMRAYGGKPISQPQKNGISRHRYTKVRFSRKNPPFYLKHVLKLRPWGGREGKRPTIKEQVYSTTKRVKEERNASGLKKGHSSRRVCCQGEKFSPCPTKAMDRCPKDGE